MMILELIMIKKCQKSQGSAGAANANSANRPERIIVKSAKGESL
jgi:hypothetical protein